MEVLRRTGDKNVNRGKFVITAQTRRLQARCGRSEAESSFYTSIQTNLTDLMYFIPAKGN
jgi:hypothetical protein